jgi:hypothetical protein
LKAVKISLEKTISKREKLLAEEWLKLKYKGKASCELFIITKYDAVEKKT